MFHDIDQLVAEFERGRLTRRQLVARIGAFAAAVVGTQRLAVAAGPAPTTKPSSTFEAVGLNHVALNVTDVKRSRDFYVRHLGLRVSRDSEQSCFLDCGEHFVALFRAEKAGLDHYCYTIKGYDPSKAVDSLKAVGLEPRRTQNRVYFDDPDGLTVQVSARNE